MAVKSVRDAAQELNLLISIFKNDNSNQAQQELARILYLTGIVVGHIIPYSVSQEVQK